MPTLTTIDHLVLTVADLEATTGFYCRVLGMEAEDFPVADGPPRRALRFGICKINLHQAGQEFEPKSAHPTPGSADLCFVTDAPLADWVAHLAALGVPVIEGPVPRTGAAGAMMSIYCRDPDQNLIEIARYG